MSDQLPPGWVTKDSSSRAGYFYYYNTITGASQWDRPFTGKVRVSHLLVKHTGSRNPSSWRETRITRSKEEAIAMLQQFRGMLAQGAQFADLCATYSDCKSAKNGGDLGFFGRGEMQKPFEEAAYALRVGEMSSDIVDTDSGVHILLRTA